MSFDSLQYGQTPPVVTLYFTKREPVILYDRDEILHLIVDLCEAFHRIYPDAKPQT